MPPKVEKNSMPLSKERAISRVVTTAASGWPAPMGLPRTRISGTAPCISKAQKWLPTRPKPAWTSSAMHTPPARRTWSKAAARNPGGGMI